MVISCMTRNPATIGTFFRRHKLTIVLGALLAIVALRYWQGRRPSETIRGRWALSFHREARLEQIHFLIPIPE
jgi:hypothetical protein